MVRAPESKVFVCFCFVLKRNSMVIRKNEKKTNITIWPLQNIFPQKPRTVGDWGTFQFF